MGFSVIYFLIYQQDIRAFRFSSTTKSKALLANSAATLYP
uniref:Uncharacterized protein n=1 Tax=Anguilla anguilla TaxID=7936 RepID=A0A0E9SE20_ANGAN